MLKFFSLSFFTFSMSETEGGSSPAGIVEEEMGPAWGYIITCDTG